MALARTVTYAQAYSFKYSIRPGTPAATMPGQVPEQAKTERLAALQDLLAGQQRTFNAACVDRRMTVLLEKPGRKPGQLVGRSPYLQAVHVDGCGHGVGDMVEAMIDGAGPNSLSGRLLTAAAGDRPWPAVAFAGSAR
jgi:tRNA-2-methylthio-N6-dimethylallyladenosine synthase